MKFKKIGRSVYAEEELFSKMDESLKQRGTNLSQWMRGRMIDYLQNMEEKL